MPNTFPRTLDDKGAIADDNTHDNHEFEGSAGGVQTGLCTEPSIQEA